MTNSSLSRISLSQISQDNVWIIIRRAHVAFERTDSTAENHRRVWGYFRHNVIGQRDPVIMRRHLQLLELNGVLGYGINFLKSFNHDREYVVGRYEFLALASRSHASLIKLSDDKPEDFFAYLGR